MTAYRVAMINAINRYFKSAIPIDCAAESLFFIARKALPVGLLMMLSVATIIKINTIMTMKLTAFALIAIPKILKSRKLKPFTPFVKAEKLLNTSFMISANPSVMIARYIPSILKEINPTMTPNKTAPPSDISKVRINGYPNVPEKCPIRYVPRPTKPAVPSEANPAYPNSNANPKATTE